MRTSIGTLLLAPAILLVASQSGFAQAAATGTSTTTHRPVHRLPVKPAAKPAGETCMAAPVTPAGVPAVTGPVKAAYALRYVDISEGTGEEAPAKGFFTVHYTGWLASDGKKFDSSVDRGEPITFPVGAHKVIPGWDTGFTGMKIGGKRRLFIPYQLAYGEMGRPPVIPAKSDLIFDVELISVSDKPPAPKAPPAAPVPPAAAPAGTTPPAGSAAPATAAPANATPPATPAAQNKNDADKPAEVQK